MKDKVLHFVIGFLLVILFAYFVSLFGTTKYACIISGFIVSCVFGVGKETSDMDKQQEKYDADPKTRGKVATFNWRDLFATVSGAVAASILIMFTI